jgi:hypothetical protein
MATYKIKSYKADIVNTKVYLDVLDAKGEKAGAMEVTLASDITPEDARSMIEKKVSELAEQITLKSWLDKVQGEVLEMASGSNEIK